MNNHFIKSMVVSIVNDACKCDLPELVVELTSKLLNPEYKITFPENVEFQFQLIEFLSLNTEDRNEFIIDKISEVIHGEEVAVIVYTLPDSSHKQRIILFPKGTKLQIGEPIA